MLRQLWRLSRRVDVAGEPILAPAVYAERRGHGWRLEHADETGYEGVACVDDAARLSVLLLRAFELHGLGWARDWALANLRFLAHMQQPDGSFANFILDWDGSPNLTGPTSRPSGLPWLSRAAWAFATAYRVLCAAEYRERYYAALACMPGSFLYADTAATAVLSALEMHAASPDRELLHRAEGGCEAIIACRRDGILLNSLDEDEPHLWGHIQPGALCEAAAALGRPEWIPLAEESARLRIEPVVLDGFRAPRALPYDVSSVTYNYDSLSAATGDARYTQLARFARSWFEGRNSASRPVYDRELGMVFDGIDGDRVSRNSGAESNIEGAFALFESLPWVEYRLGP